MATFRLFPLIVATAPATNENSHDDVLPLQSRIESVADEVELDDVYETERQLLYVACTRARDHLLVSIQDQSF